jgi:signal transduction histidine kinase
MRSGAQAQVARVDSKRQPLRFPSSRFRGPRVAAWLAAWLGLMLAGGAALVRWDIAERRAAFQADARVAHRLLSQRAVQHEAILATLALLHPAAEGADRPEQRLPAVYPQLQAVLRREPGQAWPEAALQEAETRSRQTGHAELAGVEVALGRYTVVQAGEPSSFALRIDVQRLVPWDAWPVQQAGPISVALRHGGQTLALQAGQALGEEPAGLTPGFVFSKVLDAPSQPFELQLRRATGPAQWPWKMLFAWAFATALLVAAVAGVREARRRQQRAEALMRVGQVARLNAMGELAAGMAHELNQPLAAVMAGAQAARRLLDDDPPELDTARQAITQMIAQGRRAADVVARLRRQVEAPEAVGPAQAVQLAAVARQVLGLLEPETQRLGIRPVLQGQARPVRADPVALEQIVHNLIGNALQALENVPRAERRLLVTLTHDAGQGVLTVRDSGPGITDAALPHLFEPFYTTKRGGLGLGLSLCETLAQAQHGTLSAHNIAPRGAEFRLALPLAEDAA